MAKPTLRPERPTRDVRLRLPADVYAAVFALADDEMRTLNATVLLLLHEALSARGLLAKPARKRPAK